MKDITRLLGAAKAAGIKILPVALQSTPAIAVQFYGRDYITMDGRRVRPLKVRKVVLAHEIGHHMTGSLYLRDTPLETRERCESRARRWAIHDLLPFDKLRDAMREGYTEPWQLAEYFNIDEKFVRQACEFYTEACGMDFNDELPF